MKEYRSLQEWVEGIDGHKAKSDAVVVQIRVADRRSGYDSERCKQTLLQAIEKDGTLASFESINDQRLGVLLATLLYGEVDARNTVQEFLRQFRLTEFCHIGRVFLYDDIS